MSSWKDFHTHPEFSPVFVMNNWGRALDITSSSVVDTDTHGHTLLHLAVYGLKVTEVSKLISLGADVNAESSYGFKPHHMLMTPIVVLNPMCEQTRNDVSAILKMLIDRGAIDTAVFKADDDDVHTFAMYAEIFNLVKKKMDAHGITNLIHKIKVEA